MASVIKPPYFEDVVNEGERRLLNYLEAKLPSDYYLIPNIEITSTNPHNHKTQTWEYDLVVVAPHAIYQIENKDWRGRIEGDDNYWYLNDQEKPSPIKTTRQKTAILASKLKENNYSWGRAWVQNLVTLSYPNSIKPQFWKEASKLAFCLEPSLISYLTNPSQVAKQPNDIAPIQQAIIDFLIGKQNQKSPEQKREVLGYQIEEIRNQDKYCTEYLVKSPTVGSAVRRIIKEYYLQIAGLSQIELLKRELRIANGKMALEKLRAKPFIVNVEYQTDSINHSFYEISDFMEDHSLEALALNKTFTQDERLNIIRNLCAALRSAHQEKVYHRDINPHHIYMSGGYAYLGNFGNAYFLDHEEQGYTVHPTITESNATAYHPMEMTIKEASAVSDIYSLGVLIYWLFTKQTPIQNPYELDKLGGSLPANRLPTTLNPALPKWLDELCSKTIIIDPLKRLQSIDEVEALLGKNTEAAPVQQNQGIFSSLSGEIKEGDHDSGYTFYKILGKGGYSTVHRVKYSLQSEDFAMKVFNESVNAQTVEAEYNALKKLNHHNIVRFSWNGTLSNGRFYTLMEYLEGENIGNYVKTEASLPLHRIYQLGIEILSALVYMQSQESPVLHRDIKPQNIIWIENKRFVLIDFNVASLVIEANRDFVGTNPYLAPDLIDNMKVNWDLSADTFSLGVTLYELICKEYPWSPSKMPLASRQANNPKIKAPKISDAFADFLSKAIAAKKEERFMDAKAMLAALQSIGENGILADNIETPPLLLETAIEYTNNQQSFVDYINSLYSQSRHGNSGTRASTLETNDKSSYFDKLTYTPTKLDKKFIPAVLDGKFKLIIITGNAGDGKTAFIQKIEEDSQSKNLERFSHRNGSSFLLHGVRYETNYDGSQDQEESINDEVLNKFFSPFIDGNYTKATEGRIIAINEGRLVEFLQTSARYKHLAELIEEYFYKEGHAELPAGVMVINLNLRSVVAYEAAKEDTLDEPSLFRMQMRTLTNQELWKKCETCSIAQRCFIRYNVASFNDTASGEAVISRLEFLLKTASLKRELHITMRDLRSFIAFTLTRNFGCEDVKTMIADESLTNESFWKYHYFNLTSQTANDGGEKDRLINLLRETDIGEVAIPNLDRELFFGQHKPQQFLEFAERSISLLDKFNAIKQWKPTYEQQEVNELKRIKDIQKTFIRHQYFEGKMELQLIDGNSMPSFIQRIPYHSAFQFVEILKNDTKLDELKRSISKAISINEGCDNDIIDQHYLVLTSSEIKDSVGISFRLFSLADFELFINRTDHLVQYLEYEPDSLIFRHKKEKHILLTISLDLFEMLYFIQKGYSPSLNDLKGRFMELIIFKNLLKNLRFDEVVVSKDNQKFFKIKKTEANKLLIESLTMTI